MLKNSFIKFFYTQSVAKTLKIYELGEFILIKSAFNNFFDSKSVTKTFGIYQLADFVSTQKYIYQIFGTQPVNKTHGIYQQRESYFLDLERERGRSNWVISQFYRIYLYKSF